jgi:uncharacterized protein (DUF4415 family)
MESISRNDLARARSKTARAAVKHRGPQKDPTKIMISLRLDRDIVEALRATGSGWHSRINQALRKLVDR